MIASAVLPAGAPPVGLPTARWPELDPTALQEALAAIQIAQRSLGEAYGLLNACLGDAQAGKATPETSRDLWTARDRLLRAEFGAHLAGDWARKAIDPEWPHPIPVAAALPGAA
jgi:hypothetical protein